MPVLFCEKCGRRTTWILLGDVAAYCKSCGWRMQYDEFRAYRSRILREEFEKFLEEERKKDWIEETFKEFEQLVQQNERLAEEIHKRNIAEIEKFVKKAQRSGRKRRTILVVPV